jgi:probable addiction module antidote protein
MTKPKTKTRVYDAAEYLETAEDMAAYLEAALEDGDTRVIVHALGTIARARGMSQVARDAGLGRESLYKALSPDGAPLFTTVLKVVQALGLTLHAEANSDTRCAEPAGKYRARSSRPRRNPKRSVVS